MAALAMLWVGCSFVRDPDRYSEGASAGPGGSSSGGSGGGGQCKALGEDCASVDECCSKTCDGVCKCAPENSSCSRSDDCCTGLCGGGSCVTCTIEGETCNPLDPTCCPGRSCVPNTTGSGHLCQVTDACSAPLSDPYVKLSVCDAAPWECDDKSQQAKVSCYIDCLSSTADGGAGITKDCASCYQFWWDFCLHGVCSVDCDGGPSQACTTCCTGSCLDHFSECSGLAICPS